jgi:deoxyribodipyrimidine photo-lyase
VSNAIVSDVNERVRILNSAPVREPAQYVLYWTQMNRRVPVNQALEYAAEQANSLGLPLLVYEGLGCTYQYANDRLHTFVLEGVPDTEKRLKARGIGYGFYLRPRKKDPNNVLYKLAEHAALVVTDDYPVFIAPIHNASVPEKIGVAYHAVDASCIVPMSRHEKRNYGAYTIRPRINKMLPEYLKPLPEVKLKHSWKGGTPEWHVAVTARNVGELVASCEIDHSVAPSLSFHGGQSEAERLLKHFLEANLRTYAKDRNEPSKHATSHMSPYLHFGMISSLQIALQAKEFAAEHGLIATEYLEELIVRRELAFNFARFTPDVQTLAALPDWCLKTMAKHAGDKRDPQFSPEQLERGETYDQLWNATQKEMLLRGKVHGYYRMYWGKKIIEWSATYAEALQTMIYLHDRYCLDGRDPNTYTNILWCFGLHDRPWGERPIFGQLRYMSYDGMKRKTDIGAYIEEIGRMERSGKDQTRI